MSTLRNVISVAACATVIVFSGAAHAANDMQLVFSGLAGPSTGAPAATAAFTSRCAGMCFPTTNQTVYDP